VTRPEFESLLKKRKKDQPDRQYLQRAKFRPGGCITDLSSPLLYVIVYTCPSDCLDVYHSISLSQWLGWFLRGIAKILSQASFPSFHLTSSWQPQTPLLFILDNPYPFKNASFYPPPHDLIQFSIGEILSSSSSTFSTFDIPRHKVHIHVPHSFGERSGRTIKKENRRKNLLHNSKNL